MKLIGWKDILSNDSFVDLNNEYNKFKISYDNADNIH